MRDFHKVLRLAIEIIFSVRNVIINVMNLLVIYIIITFLTLKPTACTLLLGHRSLLFVTSINASNIKSITVLFL